MGSAARYERLDQIGSGTFGHAWLVRSRASGRQYVVKEVKVTSLLEHEREQSVNEVAILSQCKHVNIIRYKEAFIEHTSGSLNIVMEYADGGDLYARIVNQRAADDHFTEELVLNWFIQITFAVQYLHSKNILHRDLKTQNIFLTSDNLVKVGDFGIARTLRSTQELATTAIGTPYYLSPEICQRQPYNHKSDQWAVGCIVYEMCCLTHPFNANSFENLVLKILQARYTPIPSRYSLLLRDLVTVLLRTQPDRRPSAEQVLMIPALKPYVDSYVQWQNAVLSPRTDQRTSGSSNGSSNDSNDSNGSDTTDRDSLMLSRDDTGASTMTADSLEPVTSAESVSELAAEPPVGAAGGPSYAPAREAPVRKSGRRSAEVPTWRSKYAGDLADQGAQRSDADSERPERDQERPDRDAERPRRSSERRERGSHGGPEPGRRRSLQSGGVSATARCGDEDMARAEDKVMAVRDAPTAPVEAHSCLPAVALAGAEDEGPSHTPSCGGVGRPRSCSLSSLSPTEPKVDDSASKRLLTPDSAKLRSRPSGRGPSALIRQVLKKKFSRHEARPRSASDPSEQSPLEVRAAGSRDRSPARVFRRPSLSLARFSTPEPPSPGRLARRADAKPVVRSRSPPPPPPPPQQPQQQQQPQSQPPQSPSRARSRGARPSPSRRAGQRLGMPSSRPQSAVIARPVGRPPASRRDRSVGSSSSVGSDGSVSKKSEQQPYWSHCSEQQHQHQHQQQQCRSDSRQETVPTPHQTAAAGSEAGQHKLDSAGHSSPDRAGDTDDSDGQEKTLVNVPPQLPDINHNSLEPGGGPQHASECHSSACCSLICAQCRYDSDERLARLAWAGRVSSGRRADQAALLLHLGQTLGEERLKSALDLLHHHWDAEEVSWMEELVFVLGRQHVHLLPLMVQAVQLGGQTG